MKVLREEKSPSNFVQDCLTGNAFLTEINDYIDDWHDGDSDLSISQFLGMTPREYKLLIKDASSLQYIIAARKQNKDVASVIEHFADQEMLMAARSVGTSKAAALKQWLQSQGLWES